MRYGWTLLNLSKKSSMSTTRSLITGRPGSGATVILRLPSCSTRSLQASRLRPLMSIASEPHTPCAHERRKVSVAVLLVLDPVEQVQDAVRLRVALDLVRLPVRLLVALGVVAKDAQVDLHGPQYVRGFGWKVVIVTGL